MGLDDQLAAREAKNEQSALDDSAIDLAARRFAEICGERQVPAEWLYRWNPWKGRVESKPVAQGWLVGVPRTAKKVHLIFVTVAGDYLGAEYWQPPKFGDTRYAPLPIEADREKHLEVAKVEAAMADYIATKSAPLGT